MKQRFILGMFFLLFTVAVLLSGCTASDSASDSEDELLMSVDDESSTDNGDDTMTVAIFETNMGEFTLELFTGDMPITTGNFIKLANEGFFDGTRFHRVIASFMIQGGDPLSADTSKSDYWGTGSPGYAIEDEHVSGEELSNVRGTISMANSGPNSGGSQFFINVVDNTYLDWDKEPSSSKHPVFGKVISGMDVVDSISAVSVDSSSKPVEEVLVNSVTIKEQ